MSFDTLEHQEPVSAPPLAPVEQDHEDHRARIPAAIASTLLVRRMSDWGESEHVAADNLEWMQEVAMELIPAVQKGVPLEKLLDIFAYILALPPKPVANSGLFYDNSKWIFRLILWRMDDPRLDVLLSHETPADWHRAMGFSKQMAYDLANEVAKDLNLPRRKDQRDEDACEKMSIQRMS